MPAVLLVPMFTFTAALELLRLSVEIDDPESPAVFPLERTKKVFAALDPKVGADLIVIGKGTTPLVAVAVKKALLQKY